MDEGARAATKTKTDMHHEHQQIVKRKGREKARKEPWILAIQISMLNTTLADADADGNEITNKRERNSLTKMIRTSSKLWYGPLKPSWIGPFSGSPAQACFIFFYFG